MTIKIGGRYHVLYCDRIWLVKVTKIFFNGRYTIIEFRVKGLAIGNFVMTWYSDTQMALDNFRDALYEEINEIPQPEGIGA